MLKKAKPFIISILIALAVGGLSALITRNNMDIYNDIVVPPLSPPSTVFPVVWTILFILMGISSALVYVNRSKNSDAAVEGLVYYAISLFFNFMWSIIFFNFRSFLFAFIWLLILWVLIILTIRKYAEVSPLAAYLQIPYFLWVTFAAYLNFGIYYLNR